VSLRLQAAGGVKWTAASMITTTVVGLVQLAVLTRLLTRADFGLMAMIMTVIGFAQVYGDMGFSSAIIYRQDATRDQLSTLYWANLIGSFGIFVSSSPSSHRSRPRSSASPTCSRPMLVASLIFLITPFGQQFQMLLQKELLFRRLAAIEISAASWVSPSPSSRALPTKACTR
jgi:O-antigen/teichoic acid export membrane protein